MNQVQETDICTWTRYRIQIDMNQVQAADRHGPGLGYILSWTRYRKKLDMNQLQATNRHGPGTDRCGLAWS